MSVWETWDLLERRFAIPLEAILKTDLLRLGVHFTPQVLEETSRYKEKSYFIFSFDRVSQEDLPKEASKKAPEEFALIGGEFPFQRTIVSTRLNPSSPYRIDLGEAGPALFCRNEALCEVLFLDRPDYYKKNLLLGKPVSDMAPTIEWGYLIYITAFRLCQYWGTKEECLFCDINENYRSQKKRRSYTAVKSVEDVLEALSIINDNDPDQTSQAYTITGGSIIRGLRRPLQRQSRRSLPLSLASLAYPGQSPSFTEAEFYAQYARAIEEKFPGRWIGKTVVQALPINEVRILKEAGYRIYHPNYEVWDKRLFQKLCPGKEEYVGRDEWLRRILNAAEIFGPAGVIPNFVAGIEMAKPLGFQTVQEAIDSTAEGLEFFMSKGITPRFTVWCVEPNTQLAKTNPTPPPLEYFIHLLRVYKDTHKKYNLPIPLGYGPAGLGRALFSVSAFMDVL